MWTPLSHRHWTSLVSWSRRETNPVVNMYNIITSLFLLSPTPPPTSPAPPSAPPQLFCFTLWLAPYLPCPSPCPAPCRCLPEQGGDEAQHLSSAEAGLPAVLWWAPWFCGHVCATGPIANTECSTQGRLGEGGGVSVGIVWYVCCTCLLCGVWVCTHVS